MQLHESVPTLACPCKSGRVKSADHVCIRVSHRFGGLTTVRRPTCGQELPGFSCLLRFRIARKEHDEGCAAACGDGLLKSKLVRHFRR